MRKITLFIAVLFASVCFVSAQTADEAVAKFKEGAQKAQEKQFAAAAADYEAALAIAKQVEGQDELISTINQRLPNLYLYQGAMAVQKKDFTGGIEALNKAKSIAKANGVMDVMKKASRYLSLAYQTQGADAFNAKDYQNALTAFEKGYAEDPSNVKLANLTAKSYAELGQIDKAVEIYNNTISKNADNAKYATEIATAKADLEQYLLLEATKYSTAKDLNGLVAFADGTGAKSEGVQLLTIQLANTLNKYDVVIARGENAAAIQTKPEDKSKVYLMLGAAYQNKDNKAKALEALKKVTAGDAVAQAKSLITELSK